jgi:hypothetical protein
MSSRSIRSWVMAIGLALLTLSGAGAASACCAPPPPPCGCTPPSPPPSPPCCHEINVPGVNVNVGATVIVNANAQATALSGAWAGAQVYYGGGSSWSLGSAYPGMIQGLQVEGVLQPRRVAYQASRTRVRIVVIQAVCIDDQEIPHPASQVGPDREIDERYEGELYRCIAGTHMQWTMADYSSQISFDHGQITTCAKGQALYRGASGALSCRAQLPARDCNERSLLRRFGAGVKIVKIVTTETYTAYREEMVQSAAASSFNMSLDGGVGGVVH